VFLVITEIALAVAGLLFCSETICSHSNRIQGVAQVVAEDREEHLPRLVDALRVTVYATGKRLIQRLVEACDVVNVVQVRLRKTFSPQAQRAGAQGAVFRDDFGDVKPPAHPIDTMQIRGVVEPVARRAAGTAVPFGLARLLLEALGVLHVARGSEQDRFRIVAQCDNCHSRPGRKAARKRFPFREDRLDIRENEFSQSHRLLHGFAWYQDGRTVLHGRGKRNFGEQAAPRWTGLRGLVCALSYLRRLRACCSEITTIHPLAARNHSALALSRNAATRRIETRF